MKLDDLTLEYLSGKKFSNGFSVPYSFHESIPDRIQLLTSLAERKKVLHLGCLDHLPLIDKKIIQGKWLHKELSESAEKCLGIDIDEEVYEYVNKKYGFNNIILKDITGPVIQEVQTENWDYAILGELLEHIDNPVAYLEDIRSKYSNAIDRIIITVPNVLNKKTFSYATKSIENINTDHRYWFTPYTLAKVMFRAGIMIEDVYFANLIPLSVFGLVRKKIYTFLGIKPKYQFYYSTSIVAIGKLK